MRVRYVLLSLCLSLLTQIAAATEKNEPSARGGPSAREEPSAEREPSEQEELPALELLGFIADFSDDDEGWVDPQELEELFAPGSVAEEPGETTDPAESRDDGIHEDTNTTAE